MPLGSMAIASILADKHGIPTLVVDLPVEDPAHLERHLGEFWDGLSLDDCLFVGFSTMCNTIPRTLLLARLLRQRYPKLPIVFGGPEVTASFGWLTATYEFIDAVVLGEAESVIVPLLNWLNGGQAKNQPGLWLRASQMPCSPGMAALVDLDTSSFTDYATYPVIVPGQRIAIEVGRGCPYACTFCSTKSFFRRRFRLKSPDRIINEINAIEQVGLGASDYDFVHDMFTTNRRLVVALCEALITRDRHIRWSCSSRTDRIDAELLQIMWRAGCRDIFFGLETGSQRTQMAILKKLDLDDAESKIALAISMGFDVTCALIIGFTEEDENDLAATIDLFLKLKYATPGLNSVQMHLLAPMVGTEIHDRQAERLRFDGFMPAVSAVNSLTDWEECQIRANPEAFSSFYYLRHDSISRSAYKWLYRFLSESLPVWGAPDEFFAIHGRESGRRLVALARTQESYPMGEVFTHRWTVARRNGDTAFVNMTP